MSSRTLPYHLVHPNIIAFSIALPVAGALLVAIRFRIRRTQRQRVAIDDWLILVALMMVVGMGACLIVGVKAKVLGWSGRDGDDSSSAGAGCDGRVAAVEMQHSYLVFHLMMLAAYALTKLSIIYFLRRLFVVQKTGPFNWITKSLVVVVSLWHTALVIFFAVAHSTNSRDDRRTASMTFLVTLNGEIGMAASDSLLDIVIFILPFPMIWSLHMSMGRKAAVSFVFLIGGCAFGASLVRLAVYLDILRNRGSKAMNENIALTIAMYWAMMEAGLGLIAACLPSLSALLPRCSFTSTMTGLRSATTQGLRHLQRWIRFQETQKEQSKSDDPTWESQSIASHAKIVTTPNDLELEAQGFVLADGHQSHTGDTTNKMPGKDSLSQHSCGQHQAT